MVSRTTAEVLQCETTLCQSGNSAGSCRVLPAHHHTYRHGVLLTKSEKTVVIQIQYAMRFLFSFAQWRIIFEALLLFPYPFPLALNPLAAEDNVPQETGQHRHVANKESAQPSKVALYTLALMFPADASLLGNFKLYLWKVIWADGKSDRPRTPSTKPGLQ